MTKTTRAAIYCRISRDTEGTEIGVANQEATCRALAAELGLSVAAVYVDNDRGASSLSRKARPDFDRMTEAAKRGEFSTILAYSMSRLTRRPSEWESLISMAQAHGIEYAYRVSPKYDLNTADGRATARTVAAWDAAEAERTGERVRHAKANSLAKGKDLGGPRPFGWEPDRRTHRTAEADLVRSGAEAILTGASVRSVATAWDASGITPPRAGRPNRSGKEASARWRPQTVRSILSNPRQTGHMVVKGVDYGRVAEPILTDDQHQALVAIFADPDRKPKRGPAPESSTALRWVTCGVCGGYLRTTGVRGKTNVKCAEASYKPGVHPTMSLALLEAALRDATLNALLRQVDEGNAPEGESTPVEVTTARLAITELERQRAVWQEQATWEGADLGMIQRKVAEIAAELTERRAALDAMLTAGATSRAVTLARAFIEPLSEGGPNAVFGRQAAPYWAHYWDSLSVEDRRELGRGVLGEVALLRADKTRTSRLRINGIDPGLIVEGGPLGEEW